MHCKAKYVDHKWYYCYLFSVSVLMNDAAVCFICKAVCIVHSEVNLH